MVNEFEEYSKEVGNNDEVEYFDGDKKVEAPKENYENSDDEGLIDENSGGVEYDISKAPKKTKAPERINLDGKKIVVEDMKLILPPVDAPWKPTRQNTAYYKDCMFILYYNIDGQVEYYSGVKVFKRPDGKYSHPTIQNDAKTQATNLKKTYAKYKGKKVENISLYEFFNFLKSKPAGKIKYTPFEYDDKITNKNIIVEFLK